MKIDDTPRFRMFASPNGSGKTTLKNFIANQYSEKFGDDFLAVSVNADEIEKQLNKNPNFCFSSYRIRATLAQWSDFCARSTLLKREGMIKGAQSAIVCEKTNTIDFSCIKLNSYLSSTLAAFLCEKLLQSKISFNFETVMSHLGKVDLLLQARENGYRTYLYFVATEDSAINIERVEIRVENGGHSVPPNKIIARYSKSIENLICAIQHANRAYIFDNSLSYKTGDFKLDCIVEFENNKPKFVAEKIPQWLEPTIIKYLE